MAKAKQLGGIQWFGCGKRRKGYRKSRKHHPRIRKSYAGSPMSPIMQSHPPLSSTALPTQMHNKPTTIEVLEASLRFADEIISTVNAGAMEVKSLFNPLVSNLSPPEIDYILRTLSALHHNSMDDIFALSVWQARKQGFGDPFEKRLAEIAGSKVPSIDWHPELRHMFCEHCDEVHEVLTLGFVGQTYEVCLVRLKVL